MAVYSTRYRYIFFANPQAASKAIAKTLEESLEGQPMPAREIRVNGELVVKKHHATWQQLQDFDLMTRAQLDALFKFTSVRNPYDLLVSRYFKRKGRFVDAPDKYRWAQDNPRIKASMQAAQELPFPEWLAGQLQRHREKDKTVKGPLEYLDHADYVIRFEALQAGFDEVLKRLGIAEAIPIVSENVTVERAQGSAKRHYTEFYDDASRALVSRVYAPIIERFGYSFG
ncbi:sulfotransferase family 2 domain-containing protein [Ideonella sp.]|uniref:sulfotransferase family 2 domain-containing protein n=1 Tax=Ideonella sp. TaxID=1929293 RepID=UPI002B477883|nr:sulfotransferase family 2 domain-containing protein [Ideonella sp.]HJV70896.1 sulfotransferase family 2 domain-containing protein [Ideonella sp.]